MLYNVYNTLVKTALEPYRELMEYVIDTPQIEDFSMSYGFKDIIMNDLQSISLEIDDVISGILIGCKGRFIAIKSDDIVYLINTKDLIGCIIDTDKKPFGAVLKSSIQMGLL